jgi:hypothetical protein
MDIVERLLSLGGIEGTMRWYINPDGQEAADEIERLREALKYYADPKNYKVYNDGYGNYVTNVSFLDEGEKARAALKGDE